MNEIILKVIQCAANVTSPKLCMSSDVLDIFFFVSLESIKWSGVFLSLRCWKFELIFLNLCPFCR